MQKKSIDVVSKRLPGYAVAFLGTVQGPSPGVVRACTNINRTMPGLHFEDDSWRQSWIIWIHMDTHTHEMRIAYQYCTWQCENEAERSGDSGGQELGTLHEPHRHRTAADKPIRICRLARGRANALMEGAATRFRAARLLCKS
jgi:hypothetical protein